MTILDTARKLRVPGVHELVAFIDPTKISNRTKLAAQRMIRSGVLTHGYSSKTRALAQALLTNYLTDPTVPIRRNNRFLNLHMLDADTKRRMVETAELGVALAKMNDESKSQYKVIDAIGEKDLMISALAGSTCRQGWEAGECWVSYRLQIVHETVLPQFHEVFDKSKTPEHYAALNAVADLLDQPLPLRIAAPL
jgi:hypothetical protein